MSAGPAKKVSLKVSAVRSVSAKDSQADRESLGQVRKTFVFLGFVAIAYVVYLVFTGQVDEFVTSLAGVDVGWIVAGIVCFLFYYVFGVLAYVLSIIADPDCPVGIRDLMSVEASGVFFMRLTPGGAGAPPAQIFRLTRAGLSVGAASALNFTRFVIYEAGEGVFAAIMLVFCGGYFYETFGDVTFIGLILFGTKVIQLVGILALCLLPRPVMFFGNKLLRFANRRGLIKDDKYEHYYELINTQVMEFSTAFKRAAVNVREMFATLVVTLLQLGCMYALPFFVLRSFGEPADLLICLASGSMLELLINAIPLPGGTGGAEVGFAYLFKGMFGQHLAAGFVIWRAVEYLLPVLVAAPCMGLRSTTGESINRRANRYWGKVRGLVRGAAGRGKPGARRVATGGVTIKPKAAKRPAVSDVGKGATSVSPAAPSAKGSPSHAGAAQGKPATGSSADIAARIAAGKAAAAAKKAAAEAKASGKPAGPAVATLGGKRAAKLAAQRNNAKG